MIRCIATNHGCPIWCYYYYYYNNKGACNMSKKVKYFHQQNPIVLKTILQTDTRKTGNYREG